MKRQPHGVLVRCPAHDEKHPSCSVRVADDGTLAVKCHACGFSADVLGLVAHVRGLDAKTEFRAVLAEAAHVAGRHDIVEALSHKGDGRAMEPKARPVVRCPAPQRNLVRERAADALLGLEMLDRMPDDGVQYLTGRGVYGYAEALGCRVLPAEQAGLVAALLTVAPRSDLRLGSILRPDRDALEWSEHRLLIPWRRRDGSVAILQRRLLRAEHEGERKYQVQRGPMVDVEPFGAHIFDEAACAMPDADVVIVEGALDVAARMTLAMHARENVIVLGAFNVTAFSMHDWAPFVVGRRVRIAVDADKAGEESAPKFAAAVVAAGAREVIRERPRGAADWGELLVRRTAA